MIQGPDGRGGAAAASIIVVSPEMTAVLGPAPDADPARRHGADRLDG